MNQRPLESLDDLTVASLDPRALRERYGLPQPLSKFAANGTVKEGPYADAILKFVNGLACGTPGSAEHRAATWFLFQSEQAFFVVCSEAGIDAGKLRSHLQIGERLCPDEILRNAREDAIEKSNHSCRKRSLVKNP